MKQARQDRGCVPFVKPARSTASKSSPRRGPGAFCRRVTVRSTVSWPNARRRATVRAGAVILATGSISSNEQLIRRFYGTGEYGDVRIMANVPHNTGDGLVMAEEAGAAAGRIGTLFIGPHNHYPGGGELTGKLCEAALPQSRNMYGERVRRRGDPRRQEFGCMFSAAVDNATGQALLRGDRPEATRRSESRNRSYAVANGRWVRSSRARWRLVLPSRSSRARTRPTWRERIMEHMEYEQAAGRVKICQTLDEVAAFVRLRVRDSEEVGGALQPVLPSGLRRGFPQGPRLPSAL